ncbi:ATP-binding protein [Rhodocytophaga aerolata]|uniref:histidine kinase n=1 Tax=Rhodocytophaga aerolata TaxID=455078 RepID=A0ABT8R0K4_9BACT|nr:PAS domain-containing hybrid sensor histidine kinase/response regulator [Rhodocytophaga aerolata]MDO1444848.1 ATP-binding protein [Rhodocytophaga aerolata]
MNKFIKLWNRFSYIGLNNTHSYLSNRKIILCNQLGFLVVINTVLYDVFLIAFHIHSLIFLHTLCIGIYLFVFWLNRKGHYTYAKYFLLFTACTEIFYDSLLLGMEAGIYLCYFPLVCAALVLFDYREMDKSLLVLSVSLVSLFALHLPVKLNSWIIPLSPTKLDILYSYSLLTSLLLTILCLYHLIKANYFVENELTSTVLTEESLNKVLTHREEELKTNLEHLSKLTREIDAEKAKLSAIVENANHYIWSLDSEYKLTYYNSRYKKLFYYRFGADIKTGDNFISLLPPKIARQWKGFYDRALAGDKFSVELPGENFYKEVFFNPIIDKDKKVVGVTTFMQNINDRKVAEIELIAAKEMAEQATRIKSDFLSNMSHEIRTPMNAVLGLSNLLLEQNPRPDQVELLKVLRFSSENLLALINDILDLQKIEAGKILFEEATFNIKDLLHTIIYAFTFNAAEKGISITLHTDKNIPEVLTGDPVRLTQVLNNLLSNAIKFTNAGSIKLHVSLTASQGTSCNLSFSVTDTGIGIPAEKLEKIFLAFEQAEPDTTKKYGGTGLGLAISKKLIELQNGKIWVNSLEGIGSTFGFCLPFRTDAAKAAYNLSGQASMKTDLGHIRLLLVEDNQVNIMVAQKFLQKWNITADVAEDGRQALEKVQQKTYDLVLMDLQMPVMNGLEAASAIRRLSGEYEKLSIIALTADVSADIKQKIKEAGMNHYLAKPFHPTDLYQVIVSCTVPVADKPVESSSPAVEPENKAKELNYQQIQKLAEGDKQFMQELLDACLNNISELQGSYTSSMHSKNVDGLRDSMHKFKSLLQLLDLAQLHELLEQSKQVLQTKQDNGEVISQLIKQTEEECSWVKTELSRYKAIQEKEAVNPH